MDDYSVLYERAFEILESNVKEGYSRGLNKDYFYISPDRIHYHQWFWDSCFHIIVNARFEPEYSKKELETLLYVQLENGFIPHIIFWRWRLRDRFQTWWKKEIDERISRYFTTEVQPPVIGISLKRIYDGTGDIEFIKKNIDKVLKFYEYLRDERDPDGDNLVSIITPMESGMDLAPHYDIPFDNYEHNPKITKKKITYTLKKYKKWRWNLKNIFDSSIFDVEDVSFNCIYCLGLKSLAELYSLFDDKKAGKVREWALRVEKSIEGKFWNDDKGIYHSIYHKDGEEYYSEVKTISSLFPLTLNSNKDRVEKLIEHLKNENEFWTEYPIPSVSLDEESFGPLTNTRFIWRGTTWINTNWFIGNGLLKHGYTDIYRELRERTLELIPRFGFCEYYDPRTGKPGRAMKDFGWSTLAVEFIEKKNS